MDGNFFILLLPSAVSCCYGLNVLFPPNAFDEILTPQMMVLGGPLGGAYLMREEPSWMGGVPLKKKFQRDP